MLRYFIFIEYGLLPDLRVGVLISASQMGFTVHQFILQMAQQHLLTATTYRTGK